MKSDNSTIDLSKHTKGEWFAVNYAGFWNIKNTPYYDIEIDLLNAEDVGEQEAEANAALIVKAVNNHFALVEALKDCLDIIGETNAAGFSKESKPISAYFKAKQLIEQLK